MQIPVIIARSRTGSSSYSAASARVSLLLLLVAGAALLASGAVPNRLAGDYRSVAILAPISESSSVVSQSSESISTVANETETVSQATAQTEDTASRSFAQAQTETQAQAQNVAAVMPAAVAVEPSVAVVALGARIVLASDSATWDSTSRTQIEQALAILPQSVQNLLGNQALGPIVINVNTEGRTSSGKQPYGGAANFFSTNEGRNELVLYPQQGVITILHELGHAYNLRRIPAGSYALALLDPEMQGFLAISGWRVLSTPQQVAQMRDPSQVAMAYDGPEIWTSLSRDDPLEDFANSFAYFFGAPETLKQLSPVRYQWFASIFGAR